MSELIGKTLGQYQIERLIGRGGMAQVYSATQASLGRTVAIKVMKSDLTDDPEFVARFEREVKLLVALEHPHIVPVIDFGNEQGVVYIVMRLVDGGSLPQRIRSGPIPLATVARMLSQIGSALSFAHSKAGIVHRDMKPSNVLLDEKFNAYLTDFGIAKIMQGTTKLTASNTVLGTPAYMSPEQWRGDELDARADIYSLGIMAYEMVTGRLPYEGDTSFTLMYKHFNEVPPSPREYQADLPASVEAVILQAIAKAPEDRFASAEDFAEAFRAAVEGRVSENPAPAFRATPPRTDTLNLQAGSDKPTPAQVTPMHLSAPQAPPRQTQMPFWLAGAAMLILAVAVLILVLSLSNNREDDEGLRVVTAVPSPTAIPPSPLPPAQNQGGRSGFYDYTDSLGLAVDVISPNWGAEVIDDRYLRLSPGGPRVFPQVLIYYGEPEGLAEIGLLSAESIVPESIKDTLENIAQSERISEGYILRQTEGFNAPGGSLSGASVARSVNIDFYIFDMQANDPQLKPWLVVLSMHPFGDIYTQFKSDVLLNTLLSIQVEGQALSNFALPPRNNNQQGGGQNGQQGGGPGGQQQGGPGGQQNPPVATENSEGP
jgi:serine/threonine protein kinase